MSVRSEAEIRVEMERAITICREARAQRDFIRAAWAAMTVQALAWVLGEHSDVWRRVKI